MENRQMSNASQSRWLVGALLCVVVVAGVLGAVAIIRYQVMLQSLRTEDGQIPVKETASKNVLVEPAVSPTNNIPSVSGAAAQFSDVAEQLGINFTYVRGETGKWWPVEPVGGGAGWLDFDGDGWLDLVLVNGAQLPVPADARFIGTRVFRNISGRRFEDVTVPARLLSHDYGQGCAAADFDNDGDTDLFVTNYGRCGLFCNQGDGTFAETTDHAAVHGGQWNTGAAFADFDRDGVLDLFVANYFQFTQEGYRPCQSSKGEPEYCGPSDSPPLPSFLYRGNGDGRFTDASTALGSPMPKAPSFGGVAADFDNDGWTDLYVANDASANFMFQNQGARQSQGKLQFKELGYEWGVAVSADGVPQASMGICCGDVDHNGFLDVGVSNFIFEYSTIYLNDGSRRFVDATRQLAVAAPTLATLGWGMALFDYDNDGWLDWFIANGHLNRIPHSSQPYAMRPHLFHNQHGKQFVDMADQSGPYFRDAWVARGSAYGDYDNDGRVDLAVVHHHRPAAVLHNELERASQAGSVTLELIGVQSNCDALNTRIRYRVDKEASDTPSHSRTAELVSGDNFLSSNSRWICLGLDGAQRIAQIELRWQSGTVQTIENLQRGTRWIIVEGRAPMRCRQDGAN